MLAVLSVWKLAAGQEAYYLQAVAQGVEDYYVGGEAPGRWIASSTTMIGLAGEVAADDLHAVLSGRDPSSRKRLGRPHTMPGFDLTFRAPKSVSVLFGLGEPGTARQVRDAHETRSKPRSSGPNATPCGLGVATAASSRFAARG